MKESESQAQMMKKRERVIHRMMKESESQTQMMNESESQT